jgi:hypothetical protein
LVGCEQHHQPPHMNHLGIRKSLFPLEGAPSSHKKYQSDGSRNQLPPENRPRIVHYY